MEIDIIKANAKSLENEMNWLTQIIDVRLKSYFGNVESGSTIQQIKPPDSKIENSLHARVVEHYNLNIYERILLALAIAPQIRPQILDVFFIKNKGYDRGFTEFGGVKGQQFSGFLPTGETAMFLMAGTDLQKRFELMSLFERDHFFFKHNIINLDNKYSDEPFLSGLLSLSGEYRMYFTKGVTNKPDFSREFPAKLITTGLEWSDLVLVPHVLEEIDELRTWIKSGDKIRNEWGLGKIIKPGYRALFYGKSGTGKTLTACLLGKACEMDVYRIDLSAMVSKYIGETEKNLSGLFDMAENKNWILFFDEADALFGKRTQTKSSNDRYANQEVSYLLQRIEDFPGLVILASNMKTNIDQAFIRRFQHIIDFPMPGPQERFQIWKQSFEKTNRVAKDLDLATIAENYELSGGSIVNVIQYSSLLAIHDNRDQITLNDIIRGIRRELIKEGKTVT